VAAGFAALVLVTGISVMTRVLGLAASD
jgi:hypothetical protein